MASYSQSLSPVEDSPPKVPLRKWFSLKVWTWPITNVVFKNSLGIPVIHCLLGPNCTLWRVWHGDGGTPAPVLLDLTVPSAYLEIWKVWRCLHQRSLWEILTLQDLHLCSHSLTVQSPLKPFNNLLQKIICSGGLIPEANVLPLHRTSSLPPLDWPLPSQFGQYELKIEVQPKAHHRAHYETEGSRGAIKAASGGHPIVKVTSGAQTSIFVFSSGFVCQRTSTFCWLMSDRLLLPNLFCPNLHSQWL